MMGQCTFIDPNKYTTLIGDAANERGYALVGTRGYMENLGTIPLTLL